MSSSAPRDVAGLICQLLLAGVAAGLSDRDNSSVISVLRSLVE